MRGFLSETGCSRRSATGTVGFEIQYCGPPALVLQARGKRGAPELRLRQAAVRQVATGESHDGKHATGKHVRVTTHFGGGRHDRPCGGALRSVIRQLAHAAPTVTIRYALAVASARTRWRRSSISTGCRKNVLKGYGKDYTVDMTFTRGTPEAGTLLAAGQADMATLSFAVFATSVIKKSCQAA